MLDVVPIPGWDNLPDLSWGEKIALLAYRFLQLPQAPTNLQHLFQDRLYIRELTIPPGVLIVGGVHKLGHEMQLVKGSLVLLGPDGYSVGFQAPTSVRTGPGYQAVCFTLSHVVARTIHPNPDDIRDIAALEASIFESPESLIELGSQIEKRLLS